MLVPLEEYHVAWQQIRQESLSHSTCRVVIFVSCLDVDALAAGKMLTVLLQKHLIQHKIVPVVGYENLKNAFGRVDEAVRNVFCIGCGSNIDLEEFLGWENDTDSDSSHPRIHVLDNHRPWNLNNLFGNEHVLCYDDGSAEDISKLADSYAYLASTDSHEDGNDPFDSNDSDVVDHNENGDDIDENRRRKHARAIASDSEDDEIANIELSPPREEEGTQEDQEQVEVGKQPSGDSKRRRTLKSQYTRVLEEYYRQGSHLASTNAVQIYTLLTMIGETSPRALWLAIVGLTSIEPQHPQLYRLLLPSLQDEMRRLNQVPGALEQKGDARASGSRSVRFAAEPDYALFLLRQWSLYESMLHSSYVSAKLFLWREDGRKKLHKLLARIGITLQDSRESWMHMKPHLKRELKPKLDSVVGMYGIEGITRNGVVRHFGLDGSMSAGDSAESVAAFLEAGDPRRGVAHHRIAADAMESSLLANGDSAVLAADASIGSHTEPIIHQDVSAGSAAWVDHFWIAWDAIESFDRLSVGAEQAKILQRAVVATANFVFEKNLPKDLHSFRMVIVQDAPDMDIFLNPLSLQRLAVWISEGCAEIHALAIPLVLAVLDEEQGVYLVFGMAEPKSREQPENPVQNNHFGRLFQETAAEIHARIRVDAFEASIIEVAREDLPRFLEALDSHV